MTDPVCPRTGAPMPRDTRPLTLGFPGLNVIAGMLGRRALRPAKAFMAGRI